VLFPRTLLAAALTSTSLLQGWAARPAAAQTDPSSGRPSIGVLSFYVGATPNAGSQARLKRVAARLDTAVREALQRDSTVRWSETHEPPRPDSVPPSLRRLIVEHLGFGTVHLDQDGYRCELTLLSQGGPKHDLVRRFREGQENAAGEALAGDIVRVLLPP
jgi:hypothetical protein